jgi:hypothetical protein
MTAFERTPLLADVPPQPDATWRAESPTAVVHQERLGMSDWDFRWLLAGLWILSFTASLDSTIVATLTSSIGQYGRLTSCSTKSLKAPLSFYQAPPSTP